MAAPLRQPGTPLARPDSLRPDATVSREIARLDLLRGLTMGAAHTANNAFTAILGETLCLLDERKDDPVVAEACALIQQQVERCARLTRLVATRLQQRESLIDETDLGSLLRGIEPLLRETVSRAVLIACEIPGPGLCVRGGNEDLELLVMLLAYRMVRSLPGGGRLRLGVESAPEWIDLVLTLEGGGDAGASSEASGDAWQDLVDAVTLAIAESSGVRLVDAGPRARRLRFERTPDR